MKTWFKYLPLLFVSCVVFVMAMAINVRASDGINLDSVEVAFHIPEREITLTEVETLSSDNVIEFTVSLGATGTGLPPYPEVDAEWLRNGARTGMTTHTNIVIAGVDPTDADRLISFRMGVFPPDLSRFSSSADWSLRVYIEGRFVGESEPVRINVIPASRLNLGPVRVHFNNIYDEITLFDGDPLPIGHKVQFMIDLVSTSTGLTPRTVVHLDLYINGEHTDVRLTHSLRELGIDPTNQHRLSSSFQGPPVSFFSVGTEESGDWTLRVYIAGQFIGESQPIRINILPIVHRDLESIDASFNVFSDIVTLVEGESQLDSVIETTIDLLFTGRGISRFSRVRLDWILDGEFYQTANSGDLYHFGIDPFNPTRLVSNPIRSAFPFWSVGQHYEGNWTLRVYIEGRPIAESAPIQVAVLPHLPFGDVNPSDWFYMDVAFVYQRGLMVGVADWRFSPFSPITRGMVAQVLFNMQENPTTAETGTSFSDVAPGRWYAEAVEWAYQNGLVSGFGDGTFRPGAYITRAHLTLLLNNYADFAGARPPTLTLDPYGNAIRAELAAMLHNFLTSQ